VNTRGHFITLEGGEGAGKTTHVRFIEQWLTQRGRPVITTREPGGSPLAEAVRELVLRSWDEGMTPATEALLIFAARAAHLHATIEPALASGVDIVCDRFIDASWAYQGAGRGLADEHLQALERLVAGGLRPDLTLVFDIDPHLGLRRARARGDANRFEFESLEFASRVRSAYLARAARAPERYAVIDASQPLEDVHRQVRDVIETRLA
jgi:dTMP kinase